MPSWKLGVFLGGTLASFVLGTQAVRDFKPPSTAVVDIAAVFEQYEKRKDRQEELQGDTKKLEEKLKSLEKQYKEVVLELPQLENGERKKKLTIEKLQLEMEVKELKDNELERLRKIQIKYIEELRDEIAQEIRTYAEAQRLDLVLEKTVTAEGEGPMPGFRWPIVHHVTPELEITKEIADRLNAHYRQSR